MKPVAILQHNENQQAGYLLSVLEAHGIPWRIYNPAEGDSVPRALFDFSGIVVLGSRHSSNENLPWIKEELALLRNAVEIDKPVLGHGFGCAMMAKAMGATTQRNPCPVTGWQDLFVTGWPEARKWLGSKRQFRAFDWHQESFTLPAASKRLLFGHHCLNVGFIQGKHIGLQCHLGTTDAMLKQWCLAEQDYLAKYSTPRSQSAHDILAEASKRLPDLHQTAQCVYGRWIRGFSRPYNLPLRAVG